MEKTLKTVLSLQGDAATQLSKGEEAVESAKAEMSQVREENTRLKMLLEKIESEYKSLKMRVEDNFQQPEKIRKNELVPLGVEDEESEHDQLISLRLGTNRRKKVSKKVEEELKNGNGGLNLGLDNYDDQKSKLEEGAFPHLNSSPDHNSILAAESKEEDGGETWLANKGLKAMRSSGDNKDDVSHQINNNVKRARVSVRARCTTPTMNDGCQWRKYGQKIAKSNPCPRAYYRCTVAASCPVRKQVQRCAEDTSILITTYEGTHNHPLPISATAMASTTSAAASMLLSGSSSSSPPPPNLTTSSVFHGFNSNNPNSSRPFYMSNPSSSPPFPTITLDLTASPPSNSSSPFNMAASPAHGLYPFTGLGYSNVLPTIWDTSGNLAYGRTTPFFNRTQNIGSFQTDRFQKYELISSAAGTQNSGSFHTERPPQEHLFQSAMNKYELMSSGSSCNSQQVLTETLTRAITSDPNFRSVIAAAISTMNGGGGSSDHDQSNSNVEMLDRNMKWDDQEKSTIPIPSPAAAAHQAI